MFFGLQRTEPWFKWALIPEGLRMSTTHGQVQELHGVAGSLPATGWSRLPSRTQLLGTVGTTGRRSAPITLEAAFSSLLTPGLAPEHAEPHSPPSSCSSGHFLGRIGTEHTQDGRNATCSPNLFPCPLCPLHSQPPRCGHMSDFWPRQRRWGVCRLAGLRCKTPSQHPLPPLFFGTGD